MSQKARSHDAAGVTDAVSTADHECKATVCKVMTTPAFSATGPACSTYFRERR